MAAGLEAPGPEVLDPGAGGGDGAADAGASDGSIRNPWIQIWAPTPWSAASLATSSEKRVTNGSTGSPKAFQ